MAEDGPGQDSKTSQDARLASLDERLARVQAEETARTGRPTWRAPAMGQTQGGRVLSVLVGYPLGCGVIGYTIDRFAGTRWVVLVMLVLGFGVAMREVWKISQEGPK